MEGTPSTPPTNDNMPTGIMNPGNFCYINAAVQCLRHVRPIIDFINGSEKMDNYLFDIIKTFDMVKFKGRQEMERRLDMILSGITGNHPEIHALIGGILERQGSNMHEFAWYIKKMRKETTKLFLYVSFRDFLINLQADNRTAMPNQFISMCNLVFKDFGMEHLCNGEQNDAQEFIIVLIDYLHDSHSRPNSMQIPGEILVMSEADIIQLDPETRIKYSLLREISQRYAKEFTTLNPEMYFYSIDIITCSNQDCKYQNIHFNPMNILCLPLDNAASDGTFWSLDTNKTIYDYMDRYFSTETLDSDYACDKCKNKHANTITRNIITNPLTLIISLKRFAYDSSTGRMKKINSIVDYPFELDISKYCIGVGNTRYRLIGCINHTGRLNFGHYYSFIRRGDNWFMANDEHVMQLDANRVLNNPDAYILFYEAIS